jgi:hypothetical protein
VQLPFVKVLQSILVLLELVALPVLLELVALPVLLELVALPVLLELLTAALTVRIHFPLDRVNPL